MSRKHGQPRSRAGGTVEKSSKNSPWTRNVLIHDKAHNPSLLHGPQEAAVGTVLRVDLYAKPAPDRHHILIKGRRLEGFRHNGQRKGPRSPCGQVNVVVDMSRKHDAAMMLFNSPPKRIHFQIVNPYGIEGIMLRSSRQLHHLGHEPTIYVKNTPSCSANTRSTPIGKGMRQPLNSISALGAGQNVKNSAGEPSESSRNPGGKNSE